MENIVISTSKKEETDFILQLMRKLGFKALVISDEEKRMKARGKLVKLARSAGTHFVSEDEVEYEVKKVRRNRHGKKK
ncbi:MAG TPA: hypothetical protein VL651_11205 [Bacteroidia bacterium]|jgi:hypothetical protein|nr:hypothetical protein [Bacteroidia bacterium]